MLVFGSKCLLCDSYLVVSLQLQNEFLSYDELSELNCKLVWKEFIFHASDVANLHLFLLVISICT